MILIRSDSDIETMPCLGLSQPGEEKDPLRLQVDILIIIIQTSAPRRPYTHGHGCQHQQGSFVKHPIKREPVMDSFLLDKQNDPATVSLI